jgi:hypothetical protein
MATRPLPTIATDQQGRPVKQKDGSEALLKTSEMMVDIQKVQLDIFSDIRGIMRNIAENVIFVYSTINEIYRQILEARGEDEKLKKRKSFNAPDFVKTLNETIEKSLGKTKNKLAEAEKEREGKLVDDAAKPESLLDSLKKIFEDYFGIFRIVFNALRLILLPLVFGFIAGFREKFDLFTVALGVAIMFPIKTFKFMVKVFGFLFETLKSIGKLISKIGPAFQDAVQGITNFFRRMRIFFLRTLDLKNILKPITSLFSSGAGIFQGLAKVLGGIFRLFGKLFIPLTVVMAVYDGIIGAIEGFKEDGIIGGIKGALVGIIDGLIGWLVGIGQWIVSNLLELFGFDELAKTVDEFNFKEFLKKYISFLSPIGLLIGLFDESSPIRKQFSAALDKLSNVGNFVSMIWDSIIEAIKTMLIKIGEAIPGGSMLLSALGLGDGDGDGAKPNENEKIERLAKQAEDRGDTDLAEELRSAKNEKEAKEALMDSGMSEAEARVALDPEKYAEMTGSKPTPVPPQNKAEELDKKTREAETAKKPEPPKPTQNNTTVVNAPNNSKTTANMNPAPHADRVGIGSRGNAAYAGFGKSY